MTHSYTTLGGKIVREVYGSNIIDYFYDNSGRPYKLVINENGSTSTGYFVLNLQGDVIAILDSSGAVAVEYEYDAWGKETGHTTSGSSGNSLYSYNALKYRGYYYDAETGFYYVSSRYYDPEVGRFINADSGISGVGGDIRGYNMYSYCFNNPVNMSDPTGDWPKLSTILTGVAAAAVAVATVAVCVAVAPVIVGAVAVSGVAAGIATTAMYVAGVSATAALVANVVESTSIRTNYRDQSVYVMRDSTTKDVQYVGRTNEPGRSQKEHERDPRKDHLDPLEVIFTGLTKEEARIVEQILISTYTIQNLDNAR